MQTIHLSADQLAELGDVAEVVRPMNHDKQACYNTIDLSTHKDCFDYLENAKQAIHGTLLNGFTCKGCKVRVQFERDLFYCSVEPISTNLRFRESD